jgi:hypothetical protein
MNTEDDYYDGDMSDDEYRQRVRRQEEADAFYARQRQREQRVRPSVYYSPSEDEDSGSMW